MLRTLIVCLVALLYIFLVGTPLVLYSVIIHNTDTLYKVGVAGGRMVLWLAGVKVDVRNRERIVADRAVVFMSNHQSNADAPAVFVQLPPVLTLGKKEFFRVPILGTAMRLRGFIPVERKRIRRQAVEKVEAAVRALRAGHSFAVFPEGTRSTDGRLQPFKKGVFVMAIEAGAPIVPISVSGATRIMRKGSPVIHPGTVRLTVHDPVPTEGRTLDDMALIMEEVRQAICRGLTAEELPIADCRLPIEREAH
ncbi:MAG TPA: lysophospholipid acyltransferase family protein [Terriglobia bacterium]|nr:lysophospholipid acyltransferase family protein [Terriglobia bacterium]